MVVVSMIATALLQLGGVASVLPFLSVAANPERFANSQFGYFSGVVVPHHRREAVGLRDRNSCHRVAVLASASNIISQMVVARYVGDLGHWLRMQLLAKYYSQPYLVFCLSQLRSPYEESKC